MPYGIIDPANAETAPAVTLGAPRINYGATFGSMKTTLYHELGRRIDLEDERLGEYINEAYLEIAASLKLPRLYGSYTFDTVVGQPFYMLPDSVMHTRGAAVVDAQTYQYFGGRPLNKVSLEAWRLEADISDEPAGYFVEGDVLVIWPKPLAIRTIAVDVRIEPQLLTGDTHSPILPRPWHPLIRRLARAKAFSGLLEFGNAAVAENEYLDVVRRMQDPLAEEDTGRLVGSSVPRNRRDLIRARRGAYEPGAAD